MREEQLFQLATEELNSRDRKTELWARACALATDDVDEARYLYTNLRVEELAKEHNIDLTASAPAPSERGEFTLLEEDKIDDTVSLSVQYVDEMASSDKSADLPEADATALEANAEGLTPAQVALQRARSKFAADDAAAAKDTDSANNADSTTPATEELASEEAGTKEPHSDLSLADLTADISEVTDNTVLIDAERGEAAGGDALNLLDADASPAGISEAAKTTDPVETSALPVLTDTPGDNFFADDAVSPTADDAIATSLSNDISDEITLPDPVSGIESGIDIGIESPPTVDTDKSNVATAALGAGVVATTATTATAALGSKAPANAANDTSSVDSHDDESSVLAQNDESGIQSTEAEYDDVVIAAADVAEETDNIERFEIYRNKDGMVNAVEHGTSWKALFLTIPWLCSRRLWAHTILYVLMSLVLLAGLVTMVPRALAAGAALPDMLVTAGFVILGLVGWLYLPFKLANGWHASKVTSKGYVFQASTDAESRKEAEQRFLVRDRINNPVSKPADVWKNAA